MNKRPTQCQRVLKHLKTHIGITQITAMEKYGISRLSGRIFELKEQGYPITYVWRNVTNRYGEKCRVKEYRLCKEQ